MIIVPVFVVPVFVVHVVTVPVSVVPVFVVQVVVDQVFMTIVILWVTGSMTIWKIPLVSALAGKTRRRAAAVNAIQSNFLCMEKHI